MNAQRRIIEPGKPDIVFDEKCECGRVGIEVEQSDSNYATCKSCLRVKKAMFVKSGNIEVFIWGLYYDPYIMETAMGQFINDCIEHLPEDRFPRPTKENNSGT